MAIYLVDSKELTDLPVFNPYNFQAAIELLDEEPDFYLDEYGVYRHKKHKYSIELHMDRAQIDGRLKGSEILRRLVETLNPKYYLASDISKAQPISEVYMMPKQIRYSPSHRHPLMRRHKGSKRTTDFFIMNLRPSAPNKIDKPDAISDIL